MPGNDLARQIKERLTTRQVVELYGFHPDRGGYIQCPFHTISRRRPLILTLIYRYFQSLTVMRPVKMPRPHLMRWRPVSPS